MTRPSVPDSTVGALVLVALGGALGAALREAAVLTGPGHAHPLRTVLLVNLAGAFVLGALLDTLAGAGSDVGARRAVRLFLGTGVCGGFTTYSAFAVQGVTTLAERPAVAVLYGLLTVIVGATATAAGIAAAILVRGRRGPDLVVHRAGREDGE